jgi:hypothetical protein
LPISFARNPMARPGLIGAVRSQRYDLSRQTFSQPRDVSVGLLQNWLVLITAMDRRCPCGEADSETASLNQDSPARKQKDRPNAA